MIKLPDIGVTQNKTEFLGTMGEWRIAIAGGGISHKVEKTEGDGPPSSPATISPRTTY